MSTVIPDQITAGLTLDLRVTLTAYPAPDWELSVILRGPQPIDLAATADGNQHHIEVDAATTASWEAGAYWYSARVTDGTSVYQVDEGTVTVNPDLAAVSGSYDGRGHVERVLSAIEAVIEGRATKDQMRYKINNRELERTPIGDLLQLRSQYQTELRRLRMAEKGQSLLGRQVLARF